MKNYVVTNNPSGHDTVSFRQSKLPLMFFVLLGQLDIYIHITGKWDYPYLIVISESEFLSCLEMAKEL